MATIEQELRQLTVEIGNVRDRLPLRSRAYEAVAQVYTAAGDLAERAVAARIDEADEDYAAFSRSIGKAVAALQAAQQRINQVTKALKIASQVVEIAARLLDKVT
jgi:chromosome segregation ATPase